VLACTCTWCVHRHRKTLSVPPPTQPAEKCFLGDAVGKGVSHLIALGNSNYGDFYAYRKCKVMHGGESRKFNFYSTTTLESDICAGMTSVVKRPKAAQLPTRNDERREYESS
jgi:hypothetical protein